MFSRFRSAIAASACIFATAWGASRINQPDHRAWSDYGGAPDSMQYSSLRQINKTNVKRLELAWFHPVPGSSGRFGFAPLVVGDRMILLGPDNAIIAVNAATGKPVWNHPVEGTPTERGINYWQNKDGSDRRLIFAANSYLQEINLDTGVTMPSFGNDGRVNLRDGLGRDPKSIRNIQSGTPGRMFENLIILGSAPGEGYGSPPGDIRAYDVLSGKLVWTFHTTPYPGEFGYDTWPKDAYKSAGGTNVWGEISIDEKRGIAYFPIGSPTYDFWGGDRVGANLFGDCLLALDARTGKRLWHFQLVHHDLWDYDPTTGPKLLTVRNNGKPMDIVAEPTKFGFVYAFNRVTGEPLWPIEERPVPQSDVPGEKSWPTQPFPTKPPPFARQRFTVDDINPYADPADRARLRGILLNARNEGLFTPPAMRNTIDMPGELGGANWGGSAADPESGMLFVRSSNAPTMHILSDHPPARRINLTGTPEQQGHALFTQYCEACHGAERKGVALPKDIGLDRFKAIVSGGNGEMPGFGDLTNQNLDALAAYISNPAAGVLPDRPVQKETNGPTRYYTPYGTLNAANGLPAIGPPWSVLTAYDMNEGAIKWQVPLGVVPELAAKGIRNTGSYHPTRNGVVVTAGGLIFVGTFSDRTVRAFDEDTGKVLWEHELESGPEGIPAVYQVNGREYVAFGARTGRVFDNIGNDSIAWKKGKPEAQGYYVFALK
jgi:quinoprotein glucose dehydrogenase